MLTTIREVASTQRFNALITGQPGVIKADVAALLHQYSGRSGKALIVNCSSENDDQALKRFFGSNLGDSLDRVKGISPSYLNSTHGGTLVLDDLSALPLTIQRRLALFLERGEALAVQALTPTQHDSNIIGVLREPIDSALSAGRLHEALLYELSINTILVPPLVERRDDIKFYAQQAIAH
jgi:two-component system nitrogen regulation response regulator NtrX